MNAGGAGPGRGANARPFALAFASLSTIAALLLAPAASRAGLEPYRESNDPMTATPSTDDGAFGAWHNPAAWAVPERGVFDLGLFYDNSGNADQLQGWQLGMGQGLGFAVRHRDGVPAAYSALRDPMAYYDPYGGLHPALPSLTEYQIALSGGMGKHFGGFAWHLNDDGGHEWKKSNYLSFGSINRPMRYLSIGWNYDWAPATGDDAVLVDVGIRPDGTSRFTLFADYSAQNFWDWDNEAIGVGASIRPIDGLELSGRWRDNDRFQFTAGLTLARFGARATPTYRHLESGDPGYSGSTTDDRAGTWVALRGSPPVRGIDLEKHLAPKRNYVSMDLHGRGVYQSYRWFDRDSKPLRDLTEQIRFAKEDPTVGGVAIRLSGFEANVSMMWELRESLLALKRSGKKVLIAADNMDQRTYYLACVADRLILDPLGVLVMPGVQASRTYMKNLLAKMGLGFEEWRFYKYKSALETFSRTSFSDADREQFEALVRASYEELADGIVASGRITRERLDRLVNEEPILAATRLQELGLVDSLGRWEDMEKAVVAAGGRGKPQDYAKLAARRWQPDETWGPRPTIALVYLVGECAMDTGIRARTTAPAMKKLRENKDVGAVVLRVDSPGGDALASDLVAGETRKLRAAKKPVAVSQGRVAGSGGYWISMDGDSIYTGPFTITGSIGVIGGWVWNDGFGKKTGLTSDHVQIGKSADLMGGLRVPILGATLPERNLTESERDRIKGVFDDVYTRFVRLVASARGLDEKRVRELGEGHIYDGKTAVENKLVDRIATLDETIEAMKRRLPAARNQKYRIIELPERPLMRLPAFLPGVRGLLGASGPLATTSDAAGMGAGRLLETSVVQQVIDQPGRPLLLMPGSLLPLEEEPIR
ncbi:MAG TPA: S49 family peptidase [Candidatus Eisenbacteria bacterium]|nr:S49 family peptidase [Candidatus Eisenbacteria bacterium]